MIFFTRPASGSFPDRGGLELRYAQAADADRYARDIGTDSSRTFRARLTDETRCFVALDSDRIVHASWVTRAAAWTAELKRYVRPPSGDAYVYESFTRAEARGQGLYPLALEAICADAHARSVRRVWVGVEHGNLPSLRAVTKAGFEAALTVLYRHRLGRVTVEALEAADGSQEPVLQICTVGMYPSHRDA